MQIIHTLGEKLTDVLLQIINFLPEVLLSIIFVIVGFVFGSILGAAMKHLISDILKIDKYIRSAGVDETIAGNHFTVGGLLGALVKWSVIVAFVMAATDVLNLGVVSIFIMSALSFVPHVLVAAIMIITSVILADFVARVVSRATHAAKVKGDLAASISKFSILGLGIFVALDQIIPSAGILYIITIGIVSAVSLGLGLSFGLAGKDHANRILNDLFGKE